MSAIQSPSYAVTIETLKWVHWFSWAPVRFVVSAALVNGSTPSEGSDLRIQQHCLCSCYTRLLISIGFPKKGTGRRPTAWNTPDRQEFSVFLKHLKWNIISLLLLNSLSFNYPSLSPHKAKRGSYMQNNFLCMDLSPK